MRIEAHCGACGKTWPANEELAGRQVRCPACRALMAVPEPDESHAYRPDSPPVVVETAIQSFPGAPKESAELSLAESTALARLTYRRTADRPVSSWQMAWAGVLAANLLVPGLFASAGIGREGWLGVILAVTLFWAVGHAACSLGGGMASTFVYGAVFTAATQGLPILQLIAGVVAWGVAEGAGLMPSLEPPRPQFLVSPKPPVPITNLGTFLVTLLTGVPLFALAMTVGSIVTMASRRRTTLP